VASDASGVSYEVRANSRGEFAMGGLPKGKVTLWGRDRRGRWVGRGLDVRLERPGAGPDVRLRLPVRAGGLQGFVFTGTSLPTESMWVTAVSKRTGQWWSARARRGDFLLRGLMPGRYTLIVPGTAGYPGAEVSPRVRVRAGRTRQVEVRLSPLPGT